MCNDFGFTEDDTESDSSVSIVPLQSSNRRGASISNNSNPGSGKQGLGGGYHTPYFKKHPSSGDSSSRNHTQTIGNSSNVGGGASSQTNYMGSLAYQAA